VRNGSSAFCVVRRVCLVTYIKDLLFVSAIFRPSGTFAKLVVFSVARLAKLNMKSAPSLGVIVQLSTTTAVMSRQTVH
jgi:hypothetical protein